MTEQEKMNMAIAWGVLIQWLSHRGELVAWMDNVMLSEVTDWNDGLNPTCHYPRKEYDFFDWVQTCGRGWERWRADWNVVAAKLQRELERTPAKISVR